LSIGKKEQKLTSREAELLKLFCLNENSVLDRNFALKTIWLDDNYFNGRSMDVYITKLRKYLKEDPNIEIINVHGKGFKMLTEA
jgi:DNA-binding response OmpR family regulator